MNQVVLCGSNGYAKVVLYLLQLLGYTVPYVLDDDAEAGKTGRSLEGVPVRGPLSLLPDREDTFAFLAMEDNQERMRAAGLFSHVTWTTLVHPAAWVSPSVRLGMGTYVAAGAVINSTTVLGCHVHVGTAASVGHDCIVEDFVCLEPGVRLGGGAHLCRGALCRIGSAVVPNCSIGAGAALGPRAVAVRSVPQGEVWVGVPARATQV